MEQPFPGTGLVVGAARPNLGAREIPGEWNLCSSSGNSASICFTCLHPAEGLQLSLGVEVWRAGLEVLLCCWQSLEMPAGVWMRIPGIRASLCRIPVHHAACPGMVWALPPASDAAEQHFPAQCPQKCNCGGVGYSKYFGQKAWIFLSVGIFFVSKHILMFVRSSSNSADCYGAL